MKLSQITSDLIEKVCDKRRECMLANKMDPKIEIWVSFTYLSTLLDQGDNYLTCVHDPESLNRGYRFAGYPVIPVEMDTECLIKVL